MLDFNQNRRFKLRVFYRKTGRAVWISHLELLRTIQYIIRRSALPYSLTQGFSPHMKISYSPALGVGIASDNQAFDICLENYIAPDKCLKALQEACMEDIFVYQCEYVDNKDSLAPALGDVYRYEVEVQGKIENIKIPSTITVIKKHKEKEIEVKNYLDGEIDIIHKNDTTFITFSLKYTEFGTIKPEVFLTNVLEFSGYQSAQILNFKKF